ncbi:MAG TPA: VanZ family protein [Opitutus sp.]|nr:VanZ family protein [Opitutus sp.]
MRDSRTTGDYAAVQNHPPVSRRAWLWPLLVALLIFGVSSRSHVPTPGLIPNFDKLAHFSVYGLLGTLLVRTQWGGRWAPLVALVIASLYGVTDEVHQSYVPGRSTEFADWLADTAGAAVAIFMYARWSRYRAWLEKPLRRKRRIENGNPTAKVPTS